MKNFKLTEEQFVLLTANTLTLRNNYVKEMEQTESIILKDYYQERIDEINSLFDELNLRFKTNF
jgi:DNA-directed RNA polymerase specialized sigma54-like protein